MLVAVAYLRLSPQGERSDRSEDTRYGLDAQRASIEAWAAREGVRVASWHPDNDVSGGTPADARPGLVAAIASLRSAGAGILVVSRRDRIARDLEVGPVIARLVAREGAVVRSADGASDGEGSASLVRRGVHDLFAAYEREVIRERTRAALAVKKAKGELVGKAPYGFRGVPDPSRTNKAGKPLMMLEPHEPEMQIVRLARSLRDDGNTCRKIASKLTELGFRSRAGTPFTHVQIIKMLTRDV